MLREGTQKRDIRNGGKDIRKKADATVSKFTPEIHNICKTSKLFF